MAPELGWRDHLRAGLVALHILAVLVMCLPSPGPLGEGMQKHPDFQVQLRQWRSVAGALGWELSEEEALEHTLAAADALRTVRSESVSLVQPYTRRVGADQTWRMFGALSYTPGRLRVEVYENGEWRDLYVHGDGTADWNAQLLRSERLRALMDSYSGRTRKASYGELGVWLGCRYKAEQPSAKRLRTSIQVMELPTPEVLRQTGEIPILSTRWKSFYDLSLCRERTP